jgi:Ca-activated chloride channel homolog
VTRALAALALAAVSVGWLDEHAKARDAARLYAAGKYEESVARYNEALTDAPDSPLLHLNLGAAAYKQGKYADALAAFQQVPTSDADRARTARVAYDIGNVKYRLGEASATSDAKAALGLWAEALVFYRRAMAVAPEDVDAKFNYELVTKKIDELKKKLEEEQKKKDEEKQQQEQQQPPPDQQQGDQQQQPDQQPQDQQQAEQQPPTDQQQEQQRGAGGGSSEPQERKPGEMSPQEAAALLDGQRDQEVQPDEMAKRAQHAVIAQPAQDW